MTRPFVVLLLTVAALQHGAVAAQRPDQAPPAPRGGSVAAELPDVVARVNGEPIPRAELEDAVGRLEARAGRGVPAEQRDRVFRGVLDQLIAYRLLAQESATRKVVVAEAQIDARMGEIRSQFPSDDAFQQALADRHVSLERLRNDMREQMQIDQMLADELASAAAVTPDEVEQFYATNPGEFQQGERVRASHILISVPQDAEAAAREEARGRAAAILADVKAGQDFEALARAHSQDPGSAPDGGDLGYFERGQMVGPFEEAAFALSPPATSEVVESPFGFHIIKVIDRQPARTIPLVEVRPQVEEFLRERHRQEHTDAFIESLRARSNVEIFI